MDKLKSLRDKLVTALKFDMTSLASKMEVTGLLSKEDYERITSFMTTLDENDKVKILIASLFSKVDLDSSNLNDFINILKKNPKTYKEAICFLGGNI